MATTTFTGLRLSIFVLLSMILSLVSSSAIGLSTSGIIAADSLNITNTTNHTSLAPRGGVPENLPDNGHGANPSGYHEPGGPYDYGQYWYYCGNFATGDREDVYTGEQELMDDSRFNDCWAPANSCQRIFCYETSAIYLCNDNDYELDISCYNIGYLASRVREACCPDAGISGQIFHPTGQYNVVVGYGNCNTGILTAPLAFGKGNNFACDALGGGS